MGQLRRWFSSNAQVEVALVLSVDRNGSQWIARSAAFLPDLTIQQEQTAVY